MSEHREWSKRVRWGDRLDPAGSSGSIKNCASYSTRNCILTLGESRWDNILIFIAVMSLNIYNVFLIHVFLPLQSPYFGYRIIPSYPAFQPWHAVQIICSSFRLFITTYNLNLDVKWRRQRPLHFSEYLPKEYWISYSCKLCRKLQTLNLEGRNMEITYILYIFIYL